jgi:predicted MFS family arabinose efflux permease
MSNDQLGILGSLVYAGIGVIGLFAGKLFIRKDPKFIISISLIAMIASLVSFTFTYGSSWPYYVIRFVTGAMQVPEKKV